MTHREPMYVIQHNQNAKFWCAGKWSYDLLDATTFPNSDRGNVKLDSGERWLKLQE
jgi:hypothetical protein